MNEERQLVLPLLGLAGAVPVLLLLAAMQREAFGDVARRLGAQIAGGFGVARGGLARALAAAGALLVLFGLLFGLAAFLNERGDDWMPAVSRIAGHFDDPRVAWIHEHDGEWKRYKNDFRAAFARAHPGDDIDSDEAAWERWKNAHGRNAIRAARVCVLYGALVLAAGLLDLRARGFRQRGLALIVIGVGMMVLFANLWAGQEAAFFTELSSANELLGKGAAARPPGSPY